MKCLASICPSRKKGENKFDFVEFDLSVLKFVIQREALVGKLKKGSIYAKFDLNVLDLIIFNCSCYYETLRRLISVHNENKNIKK